MFNKLWDLGASMWPTSTVPAVPNANLSTLGLANMTSQMRMTDVRVIAATDDSKEVEPNKASIDGQTVARSPKEEKTEAPPAPPPPQTVNKAAATAAVAAAAAAAACMIENTSAENKQMVPCGICTQAALFRFVQSETTSYLVCTTCKSELAGMFEKNSFPYSILSNLKSGIAQWRSAGAGSVLPVLPSQMMTTLSMSAIDASAAAAAGAPAIAAAAPCGAAVPIAAAAAAPAIATSASCGAAVPIAAAGAPAAGATVSNVEKGAAAAGATVSNVEKGLQVSADGLLGMLELSVEETQVCFLILVRLEFFNHIRCFNCIVLDFGPGKTRL